MTTSWLPARYGCTAPSLMGKSIESLPPHLRASPWASTAIGCARSQSLPVPPTRVEYTISGSMISGLLASKAPTWKPIVSPDNEITQPEDFDPRLGGGKVDENLVAVIGISSK